jgi:SPP1 family predicted phage head-tail adaptor
MRAGELRHRITLQTNTPTANSVGEFVDTWTDFVTVSAAVEPLTGNRLFAAEQANSLVQGMVRIRYLAGVVATMRIVFGTRYFQIISIIDRDEKHRELQLLYKEIIT